jgi:predicted NBD/HSP70 family sugar kinase
MLHTLWGTGSASRWELHQLTGLRANTVGKDATLLLQLGLLREREPTTEAGHVKSTGRPGVPLEIDPSGLVLGISMQPERVEIATLDLHGRLVGSIDSKEVTDPSQIGALAKSLLLDRWDQRMKAIGLSTTGKFDPTRKVLMGSWLPAWTEIQLAPLYRAIGNVPVLLENDMQALIARWLLQCNTNPQQDVLLISLNDQSVGGAILVQDTGGNAGADMAARAAPRTVHQYTSLHNELGHTRLQVETDRCYCGRTGCMTQICSSQYLKQLDPGATTLLEAATAYDGTQSSTRRILEYLSMGIGNIANTVCADRIVFVSPLTRQARFANELIERVRTELLFDRSRSILIESWNEPASRAGETAGWLALKGLYVTGFGAA